jgi:hypothetical protein
MANCIHNQIESFSRRYFKITPDVDFGKINIQLLLRIIQRLCHDVSKHYRPDFSFNQYVQTKSGSARRRFLKAYNQIKDSGIQKLERISKITAFVKNERYFEEGKAPRLIMGRDPRFNIFYARYISRFEDAFFKLPQLANACDYGSCGRKFTELYGRSSRMFENDMSAYESSQRWLYMAIEFLVYAWTCPEREIEQLSTLFAVKMVKQGHTEAGLKFYFEHCRGSGDLDTGCGNGVGNYVCTKYFKIINFCPLKNQCRMDGLCCDCDGFVIKGDDSYGTVPESHKTTLVNTYEYFGLSAKLIYRPDGRLTEFCSGHFVRVANGKYMYVQKLRKLITSIATCINPDFIRRGQVAHYYRSLGDMYSVLYNGMPIYQDIAKFLQTASSKYRININMLADSYGAHQAFLNNRNAEKVDVCPETLLDISDSNGFSLVELDCLKQFFNNTRLNLPPEQSRRCNIKKNLRANAWDDLDEGVQFEFSNKLPVRQQQFKDRLVQLLKEPLSGLSQAAKQSNHIIKHRKVR